MCPVCSLGLVASAPVPDNHHYSFVDDESFNINDSSSNNNSNNPSSSFQTSPPIYAAVQNSRKGSKPGQRNKKDAGDTKNHSTNGAASPTRCSQEDEYKTLNFDHGVREKDATKREPGQAEGDVYNHLESVNNMAATTTGNYSGDAGDWTVETGAGSKQAETGLYHVPSEDLDNDRPHQYDGGEEAYKCLDFAGQRAEPNELSGDGEGGKVYDHLQAGGEDTYSHVHRDKKPEVVADALYSHIL